MPSSARSVLVGFLLALFTASAAAHGFGGVARPVVLVAIAIGLVAGSVVGAFGFRPAAGLAVSLGALLILSAVTTLVLDGENSLIGLLLFLVLAAFFGAIPLVLVFLVAFALSRWDFPAEARPEITLRQMVAT